MDDLQAAQSILGDSGGSTTSPQGPTDDLSAAYSILGGGSGSEIFDTPAPVTQPFGNYNPAIEKYSGGVNYGTDFGIPSDTPVKAPEGEWTVLESSSNGDFNRGYGNSVLLRNAQTGEKIRLSHFTNTPLVPGQNITGGTLVGLSGMTGNATGPHLDVEYYNQQGQLQDVLNSPYRQSLPVIGAQGDPIASHDGKGGGMPDIMHFVQQGFTVNPAALGSKK